MSLLRYIPYLALSVSSVASCLCRAATFFDMIMVSYAYRSSVVGCAGALCSFSLCLSFSLMSANDAVITMMNRYGERGNLACCHCVVYIGVMFRCLSLH